MNNFVFFLEQVSFDATIGASIIIPKFSANTYGDSSTNVALLIQGGYTSLLLGADQDARARFTARKLYFDEVPNYVAFKE